MQRAKPPFRADMVGSLLRPQRIKDARAKFDKRAIDAAELRRVEDLEIEKVIHKQKQLGLQSATDGEFRRSWWHFDFLKNLNGCEIYKTEGIEFNGMKTRGENIRVTGKIDFPADHPMLAHFAFLKKHADLAQIVPKMTIPSPSVLHYRGGRHAISKAAYREMDEFFVDLGKTYRKAVKAFYDAGCRYLQFDDTIWAYLCSEDQREKMRGRGDDPDETKEIYARVINYAIAERPADMTITTHVCRGNFRSTWVSSGGYEPVAETLLSKVNYDGYFLEYDSERAGGFEPLHVLQDSGDRAKKVVLGLVTTKVGALESKDELKRRIDEAAKALPLDRLCLSPQCGFSSTHHGNALSIDEQWNKLERVIEVAHDVWG